MSTLLTAHALHVETAFGPLFNSLSFTLKKGDRIGLIGHNGCGKSTLLQVLDGTLAPTSGSVSLAGQCLMARVEQHLPEALRSQSLLQAVLAPLPADVREAQRWLAERLLAQMGFTPAVMEQQTTTLSGGQHTRLLLARALIRQPDLLLLDEPVSGIDQNGMELFYKTMDYLKTHYDLAIILISHDLDYVAKYADHVVLLDKTVAKQGTVKEVFESREFERIFYTGEESWVREEEHK